ncbi:MAG: hypothetical protein U0790_09455 [Isosphaeraceae bacterium]
MTRGSETAEGFRQGNAHSQPGGHESRISSWTNAGDEYVDEVRYSVGEFVDRHPITSLLASFGVGVGLGVLAVAIFGREEESYWEKAKKLSGHSLEDLSSGLRKLPSMEDLSSGLRRLPSKVAEYLPESLSMR